MTYALTCEPHPALQRRAEAKELVQLVVDAGPKLPAAAIVEEKLDGIRAVWIGNASPVGGELVTREGTAILGTEHIAAVMREAQAEARQELFIDAEFVVDGCFRKTLSHFRSVGAYGDAGTMFVFDILPMRVWRGEDPCYPLHARRRMLERIFADLQGDAVRVLPWDVIEGRPAIEARAAEVIAAGGEGVVVKDWNSTYRRDRSLAWQRIKRVMTLDLPIVGFRPLAGRGGMLGAVTVDHEGVRVSVSAGFSDDERRELWQGRERLIGAVAEVAAMEVTERGSLRQARWCRLRLDKAG